jgi:release factor glutamine methyltransferase
MAAESWTIRRLLTWTEDFLRKKGIESARLESQILLAHALGCPKIQLYVRIEEEPSEQVRNTYREMIKKRSEGMPVAYLVGFREFYSLEFKVTPDVLIPRPETETLVLEALNAIKPLTNPRILDLGTGSGCIAISLAKQRKTAQLTAVDQSTAALAIASENAQKHGVAEQINFLEGDLFEPVGPPSFDLIVSNPPYITTSDIATLDADVRDHEPQKALDGGADGLDFYRRIAAQAAAYLTPGGFLFLEIGSTQQQDVQTLLTQAQLTLGPSFKDRGGLPRVVSARRPV